MNKETIKQLKQARNLGRLEEIDALMGFVAAHNKGYIGVIRMQNFLAKRAKSIEETNHD